MSQQNTLFPVFIKLDQINTLIVGGGTVGTEKLRAVLKNSPEAKVTVVADQISKEIYQLAYHRPTVRIAQRRFLEKDLDHKQLVIIATNNRNLNELISRKSKERNILTNVADTPHLCDFYLGSTVIKGDLKIAISTNGKSPTLAKRMREYFEAVLPENTQSILDNLYKIRGQLRGDFSHKLKTLNDITSIMILKQSYLKKEERKAS
jgi:precorrin-2 dehydrogenase/sirohydrochlorin ferrochelatase